MGTINESSPRRQTAAPNPLAAAVASDPLSPAGLRSDDPVTRTAAWLILSRRVGLAA
jgi:hypothetical protein